MGDDSIAVSQSSHSHHKLLIEGRDWFTVVAYKANHLDALSQNLRVLVPFSHGCGQIPGNLRFGSFDCK